MKEKDGTKINKEGNRSKKYHVFKVEVHCPLVGRKKTR